MHQDPVPPAQKGNHPLRGKKEGAALEGCRSAANRNVSDKAGAAVLCARRPRGSSSGRDQPRTGTHRH